MIVPTDKLRQFAELYENRRVLCEKLEVDESVLSRMLKGHRGASASVIEKVCRFTGWQLQDAFEIVDGETSE